MRPKEKISDLENSKSIFAIFFLADGLFTTDSSSGLKNYLVNPGICCYWELAIFSNDLVDKSSTTRAFFR